MHEISAGKISVSVPETPVSGNDVRNFRRRLGRGEMSMDEGQLNTLFHERVTGVLYQALGHPLHTVTYRPLQYELSEADLVSKQLYIGGELALDFGLPRDIIFTWDENAGWNDHFSLFIGISSSFIENSLEEWLASATPLWAHFIGEKLLSWQVFGDNETPHIAKLIFLRGAILIGDGYNDRFGDGDDLLIHADIAGELDDWQLMAEASS